MKNLSSLVMLLLFSINSHAAIQLNYNGQLNPIESGVFNGQLIFDAAHPDYDEFYPAEDGSNAARYLAYTSNISQSLIVNGQAFNFQSNQINLDAVDDVEIGSGFFSESSLDQSFEPGNYDLVTIWAEGPQNEYNDEDGSLLNGSSFYLYALFAGNTFDSSELAQQINTNDLLNLPFPAYLLLSAANASASGPKFNVTGVVTNGSISLNQVPVPGSAWLFASVLAGFGARSRRRYL